MNKQEYAIVDIETTGGNAGGSRITEIAIVIHDGTTIIDRWETLVNPEKDIPLAIFALTGINNETVRDAPVFDVVSEKVYEMLNGRIFVAHNVNFDYSFVHYQLQEAGFKWSAKKLCTVRAARKILPGFASYSLGKLCNSLNISIENRHRAGGDAAATAILFQMLLEADNSNHIAAMIKKTAPDQNLPPNLPPSDFEQLPEKAGIYYFYNQANKVIYVGKAINLKKRVASHFTGNKTTAQRQNFLKDIYSISFEVCATELMALLLECSEIKKLWPEYNRALKKYDAKFGLYTYEARNGYQYLAVGKIIKNQHCIEYFNLENDGIQLLLQTAEKFNIDFRFCKFSNYGDGIFATNFNPETLPDLDAHNEKVENAIQYLKNNKPSFALIDKGRIHEERSCVWVEKGHFYGMGYVPVDLAFSDSADLIDYLTPYKSNNYIMKLIYSFASKQPNKLFFKENITSVLL